MFHFFFLISRQGKCRLAKWCSLILLANVRCSHANVQVRCRWPEGQEKNSTGGHTASFVKAVEIVQFHRMEGSKDNFQAVRFCHFSFFIFMMNHLCADFSYASLYFVCGVDKGDNELITLEVSSSSLDPLYCVFLFTRCRLSTSSSRR